MRLFRGLLMMMLLSLSALSAAAQEPQNTLTYNRLSLTFTATIGLHANLVQYPGDAPDLQIPGGPEAPHLRISLFREVPTPDSLFESSATVRTYQSTDLIQYPAYAEQATLLQALLAERADLAPYMLVSPEAAQALPFLPIFGAAQVARARVQYVNTPAFNGISYLTAYAQDVSPFISRSFFYTFQGVSLDGTTLISVTIPLTTGLLPAQIGLDFNYDQFAAAYTDYLLQTTTAINAAAPTDFIPDLTSIDTFVAGIAVTG